MPPMFVTLDVSRLSGWLNTDAYCRESKGRHTVRVWRGAGREAGGGGQRAGVWDRLQIGSRTLGGAHIEHAAHVPDAGGVEGQRLVEHRCLLPIVERRAHDVG